MVVCGVDIKAKEAILVLVESDDDLTVHIDCATKRLALKDDRDAKSLDALKAAIVAFATKNSVSKFIIKARQATGQRAAGGITFKIEALFQISGIPVEFVSPPTLAKFAKSNKGGLPQDLSKYQEDAFRAGAWCLSDK